MIWKTWFTKKSSKKIEPNIDLTISNLKPGFFVDYDSKTWEVSAYNYYEWGIRDRTDEWQLKHSNDVIYLQREIDDEDKWTICAKIPMNKMDTTLTAYIIQHGDPPDQLVYDEKEYHFEESGVGYYYKNCAPPAFELIKWDFIDEYGTNFISIEQWGEIEFNVSIGMEVKEYHFTNILPREIKL
ncbi:MAG: DUF4178 domain-containing protein [Desulfobacterales bacterium]|nr:DUF4178 domain-containing protein [Desulfobacterales bacterium]